MRRSWIAGLCLAAGCASAIAAPKKPLTVPLKDANGAEVGQVELTEHNKAVTMSVMLHNLPAGQHAIHVHAGAACTAPDFASAGGHLNPDSKHHGYENPDGHHAGDFPSSVTVMDDGHGSAKLVSKDITLKQGEPTSVYGKTIVVHELVDDQKSDPAGASGKRIACGVVPASAEM
jgi:superoxide dismutase, Cu-Zn family